MKTKILFAYFSMENAAGAERALITLLKNLPPQEYDIDLLMWGDEGYHYTQIPAHVNILPPLWQLRPGCKKTVPLLRAKGMERQAQVREEIARRNKSEGVDHLRNWQLFKTIIPDYTGYDIAVAYDDYILLKVVADKVQATKKIAWVHKDYSYFVQHHGTPDSWMWPDHQLPYYAKMDAIICVTPQNVQGFARCFPTLEGNLLCLPNMLDIEGTLRQGEEPLPNEARAEGLRLFTAGRLTPQKGIDLAIEAAAILRDRGLRFVWDIAGTQSAGWQEYQRMIDAAALAGQVRLLGELPNPYPYFKHCDIYVHPSRFEGKPLALDEAKLFARPIVATRFSSVEEALHPGKDGIVCAQNSAALADALEMVMRDAALRAQLSAHLQAYQYDNGLSAYKALFSLD